MDIIQGTLIFFFYFIKYPVVIFLPVAYLYLDYPQNYTMDTLAFICVLFIINDWFFPHKKPENCQGIKRKSRD